MRQEQDLGIDGCVGKWRGALSGNCLHNGTGMRSNMLLFDVAALFVIAPSPPRLASAAPGEPDGDNTQNVTYSYPNASRPVCA